MENYVYQIGDYVEFTITPDGQILQGNILDADFSGEVPLYKIQYIAQNEGGNISTVVSINDVPNTLLKQKEI